jgi:hypothetical protein
MTSDPSRRDTYTREALALLDEFGPASPSLGIGATQFCRIADIHRSVLYRLWDTVEHLNHDLALVLATGPGAWQEQVLAAPADEDLAAIVGRVAADGGALASAFVRGTIAGWLPGHPVRAPLVAIEDRWLGLLALRIEQRWAAAGRVAGRGDARLAAMAVSATIDGCLALRAHDPTPARAAFSLTSDAGLADRVVRILDHLSVPGVGPAHHPPERADAVPGSSKQTRLLRRVIEDRPPGTMLEAWEPACPRLVHPARLARRLDVNERRLFAMWPTAREVNLALARAVIDRETEWTNEISREMVQIGMHAGFEGIDHLLMKATQAGYLPLEGPRMCDLFAIYRTFGDPVVQATVGPQIETWLRDIRIGVIAMASLTTWTPKPSISPEELACSFTDTFHGAHLLRNLHPDLSHVTVRLPEGVQPVLGALPILAIQAACVLPDPPAPGQASTDGDDVRSVPHSGMVPVWGSYCASQADR